MTIGAPGRVAVVHVVAPKSAKTWFGHFAGLKDDDVVVIIGESHEPLGVLIARVEAHLPRAPRIVVVHSSHYTLERDRVLAAALESRGHCVFCQSSRCRHSGLDKIWMKRFFDANGFATSAWVDRRSPPAAWTRLRSQAGLGVVRKGRSGTEARGIRFSPTVAQHLGDDEFQEAFVDGVEYSIVAGRSGSYWVTFPPVWKGATRRDLLPPYQRLRTCPHVSLDRDVELALRETAREVATALDCQGMIEVEVMLMDTAIVLLEVNPRIAGTMRLASLAARVPLFDWATTERSSGHLPAIGCAAEVPCEGTPFAAPVDLVYCTSRLTVGGSTFSEVIAKFHKLSASGVRIDPDQLHGLDAEMLV